MKITAVIGSPHKDGNTAALCRAALKGAKDFGADVEEISLCDYDIKYCRGCLGTTEKFCMSTGSCVINDDVNMLRDRLYESDGIIFASPSYGIKPTAMMKNFITDRIGMYTAYTSMFAGKYFIGLSVCGGIGADKVARDLAYEYSAGFHARGFVCGYFGAKAGYGRIIDNAHVMKKAYLLGKKIAGDIKKRKKYTFQNLFLRFMMRFIVRRIIIKNILSNKDTVMKSVYENLKLRGLMK